MDAVRLVAEAERSMDRSRQPENVIAEAWQAYELTDALGRLLTDGGTRSAECGGGPGECAAERDTGGPVLQAGSAPVISAPGSGSPRASRLTVVRDPAGALRALRVLLCEIGLALVGFIADAADEEAYWQYIEALDAVDEAKDRVRALAGAHPG
jgi:hypothetical protein